jgi:hypothetical protein
MYRGGRKRSHNKRSAPLTFPISHLLSLFPPSVPALRREPIFFPLTFHHFDIHYSLFTVRRRRVRYSLFAFLSFISHFRIPTSHFKIPPSASVPRHSPALSDDDGSDFRIREAFHPEQHNRIGTISIYGHPIGAGINPAATLR